MQDSLDLTGKRFGRLVVQWPAGFKGHQTAWLALCDCGQTKVIMSYYMTSGHTNRRKCTRK